MANDEELLPSLISDIKSYTGKDPLLPWLRGIRKMKDTLSSQTLKKNLPKFLRQCTHTFEVDRRYRNDMRYLRVWLQLMDYVDDPIALLRTMEVSHIGTKRCQFYQAYALYYEKRKKYDEAEKMYHLGVKNLAEPMDELQKSYEQFLQRMERKNNKRNQQEEVRATRKPLSTKSIPIHTKTEGSNVANDKHNVKTKTDEGKRVCGDNTVVVKFVDTAIVGKSETEDACHHGLVDPTINMKEAMNVINSMFRAPLETVPVARKSHKNHSKVDCSTQNGFEIFVDENVDTGFKPRQESLQIYIDDDGHSETSDVNVNLSEDSLPPSSQRSGFIFTQPKDIPSKKYNDKDAENSRNSRLFREDTVVRRFVGSAISNEPEVENVCHHGLVEPTVNMKEAMDDINNMFGKPIDFVRRKRSRKQETAPESNSGKDFGGFSILADDDCENQACLPPPPPPKLQGKKSKESDLFEPTFVTKEAMDDINKMFNMPLDF
ncbi:PREDICTED: probable inactive serine/threonine-protein kinase bub1 isoform X1 [Lupinus angustifolius]|uniref:probable inactive serine/threonine-protein kinase bub1 isoform X1 n=1 Tax=Lupinus angustifolius TaxID=3871 RepID=UPI00092E5993|nr:PREDICTED: probable inactive serine/threonine-protein kinase bub1 isoform X1 [Lupinus angustifolius]